MVRGSGGPTEIAFDKSSREGRGVLDRFVSAESADWLRAGFAALNLHGGKGRTCSLYCQWPRGRIC